MARCCPVMGTTAEILALKNTISLRSAGATSCSYALLTRVHSLAAFVALAAVPP
jgi:hypothetical protein